MTAECKVFIIALPTRSGNDRLSRLDFGLTLGDTGVELAIVPFSGNTLTHITHNWVCMPSLNSHRLALVGNWPGEAAVAQASITRRACHRYTEYLKSWHSWQGLSDSYIILRTKHLTMSYMRHLHTLSLQGLQLGHPKTLEVRRF